MSNESEISDDFNGTESYDQEQQRNLDTKEHPKGSSNQVQKSDTERTHETAFLVNCNDGQDTTISRTIKF